MICIESREKMVAVNETKKVRSKWVNKYVELPRWRGDGGLFCWCRSARKFINELERISFHSLNY